MGLGRRLRLVAAGLVTLAAASVPVAAHDLGTTHLDVVRHADRMDVTLYGDARALLIHAASPDAIAGDAPAEDTMKALGTAAPRLAPLLRVTCDGRTASFDPAEIRWDDEAKGRAAVRFTAPPLTGACTLAYGGAMLPYALVLLDAQGQIVSTEWIAPGGASLPFSAHQARASAARTVGRYVGLGFTHIVPLGLDHVLFVLGIFLSSARWQSVLAQVTAFTIAHSITLALAMTGVVQAAPSFVEPLIAVSIVYVAVENLLTDRLRVWRLAVVFAFGLLHGLGFAGVLTELGLPAGQLASALVGFNVGVELGQLAVIGAAAALLLLLRPVMRNPRERIAVPASCAIALVGVYWTIERLGLLG